MKRKKTREPSYVKRDVVKKIEFNPRLVQYYVDEGVIKPDVYRGKTRGDRHRFSFKNLFEFLVLKQFVDHGMNVSTIRSLMETIAGDPTAAFSIEELRNPGYGLVIMIYRNENGNLEVNPIKTWDHLDHRKAVLTVGETHERKVILVLDIKALFDSLEE